jgi:hypothetical protein
MNQNDDFRGQGGAYIFDKKTGKRRRVQEATPRRAEAPKTPAPTPAATPNTQKE